MNINSTNGMGLFGIAGLTAVLLAGCGDSSTPDPHPTGADDTTQHGQQTLVIHVLDMGKRLKLM